MSARIASIVIVLDRNDEVRVSVEGVRVDIGQTSCPAEALSRLARILSGRAWSSRRTTAEELAHVEEWRS